MGGRSGGVVYMDVMVARASIPLGSSALREKACPSTARDRLA